MARQGNDYSAWWEALLAERDLTHAEIARMAGIDKQILTRWKANPTKARPALIYRVARALEIEPRVLFEAMGKGDEYVEVPERVKPVYNDEAALAQLAVLRGKLADVLEGLNGLDTMLRQRGVNSG